MRSKRRQELVDVGLSAFNKAGGKEDVLNTALIHAFAAMLLARFTKRPAAPTTTTLSPVLQLCQSLLVANNIVIADSVDLESSTYIEGRLAKLKITEQDVADLHAYILAGKLSWLTSPMTWHEVTRPPKYLLVNWLLKARGIDKNQVSLFEAAR